MKILLVVYDNNSYISWFPQGLAYVAAVVRKAGHSVTIYNQDVHHYPETHLTDFLDQNHFDAVGVSVIAGYYQFAKLLRISAAIHASKKPPLYLLGGHGPAPEPAYFFEKTGADVIILGEGEETAVELLNVLNDGGNLRTIKGIAFRQGNEVIVNERRPLIEDIDSIPWPAYDLFPIEYYRLLRLPHCDPKDFVMTVLSGRGCTFNCNFCYRLDPGFRPRKHEAIIEEIQFLGKHYGINYIEFSDELLMSSEERTLTLCEGLQKAEVKIKWACNGRLNYATPKVLKAMKQAGCVFINYGIEAMDNQVLKNMKKALNTDMIIRGVENTLKADLSPGLNIIWGNIGDNKATLDKGVSFLLKYDDGAQMRTIRPVTPYPGSDLYYHAIEKGLLKDCRDFYEHKHINSDLLAVNFTELSDEEFYAAIMNANKKLISNHFAKKTERLIQQTENLYLNRDSGFRGYRQT